MTFESHKSAVAADPGSPEPGRETVSPPPGNPRFPLLDGLRAFAAGLVLLFHVVVYNDDRAPMTVRELSALGVAIFFVLSGFLLYRPFMKAGLESDRVPSVLAYARRRVLRIFPAYWAALTFALLVAGASGVTTGRLPAYYSLLLGYFDSTRYHGLPVAWTLTIELTYYALLPIVAGVALLIRRQLHRDSRRVVADGLVTAGFFLLPAAAWALRPGEPATIVNYGDWFAGGMLLATLTFVFRNAALDSRVALGSWLGAAAVFALNTRTSGYGGHLLLLIAAVLVVAPAVFAPARGIVSSILRWPALGWLGVISYGIYLWHIPVLAVIDPGHSMSFVPLLILTSGLTIGVAAVSFYFLEAPILRFKEPGRRSARANDPAKTERPAVAGLSERLPVKQDAT